MTMRLYGNESCTSCKQALNELSKTPIDFIYVDVATIPGFTGEIPTLELESGTQKIGLGQIMQYIREWKQNEGFA